MALVSAGRRCCPCCTEQDDLEPKPLRVLRGHQLLRPYALWRQQTCIATAMRVLCSSAWWASGQLGRRGRPRYLPRAVRPGWMADSKSSRSGTTTARWTVLVLSKDL